MTNNEVPVMVTPERAAMIADTSLTTIWRALRAGKLQSYKRGPKDTRFLQSDVEAFKRSPAGRVVEAKSWEKKTPAPRAAGRGDKSFYSYHRGSQAAISRRGNPHITFDHEFKPKLVAHSKEHRQRHVLPGHWHEQSLAAKAHYSIPCRPECFVKTSRPRPRFGFCNKSLLSC